MTNAKISSIKFEKQDIINVIKALDPCKAHGYNDIPISMLKICDSATLKSLAILFKAYQGIFPDNWRKSNIFPIYNKGNKQIVNNYRPVSLLSICGTIFERLIFSSCIGFLKSATFFQFINLVFVLMTHVSTSFYLLLIHYTKLLMLNLLLRI